MRRQMEELVQKLGIHNNDYASIADNFAKCKFQIDNSPVQDAQNKIIANVNTHENEIQKVRGEIGDSLQNIRTMQTSQDSSTKLNQIIEESNKLWAFFQKFIDEHAIDRMKTIRSKENTLADKVNAMDWLARYAEFITPD